ncbi:hypothetical protein [Winogradskyella ludwigii]|uniref:hypothetical protein n=1 Tax=Winogradskyella ludwigii TaxID=2686076 RepID=UPI0015C957F7|nr:hypothetical protein [Winogradskyella ludwigii]
MKILNLIKKQTSLLSFMGLVLLLVFSPCKVRNSIQDVFEIPKTEVSNKSLSALNSGTCDISTNATTVISNSKSSLQTLQAALVKKSQFTTQFIALSERPISQYYNARAQIPPLAPYYILFQNNKAYL